MRPIDADAVPWIVADVGEIPVITKEEIDNMPMLDAIVLEPSLLKCSKGGYVMYKREWLYKHLDQEFSILASMSGQSRPKYPIGHWEETKVVDVEDCTIDQLQSARCSVCGRYHTAPYMYSWAHYDFCPHCGAKMERK